MRVRLSSSSHALTPISFLFFVRSARTRYVHRYLFRCSVNFASLNQKICFTRYFIPKAKSKCGRNILALEGVYAVLSESWSIRCPLRPEVWGRILSATKSVKCYVDLHQYFRPWLCRNAPETSVSNWKLLMNDFIGQNYLGSLASRLSLANRIVRRFHR